VRQNDKALFIVLAGRPDEQQRLTLVRDAYKKRFHQPSVMMVEERACVSF
jgi:2-oxo-4-hydroxy-4-carboxy--5-ureidoimidazoline (OHCU) decarboxylase